MIMGKGLGGNRKVSPYGILGGRADLSEATAEAIHREEGGAWGRHGFPQGSKPKARDDHSEA